MQEEEKERKRGVTKTLIKMTYFSVLFFKFIKFFFQ